MIRIVFFLAVFVTLASCTDGPKSTTVTETGQTTDDSVIPDVKGATNDMMHSTTTVDGATDETSQNSTVTVSSNTDTSNSGNVDTTTNLDTNPKGGSAPLVSYLSIILFVSLFNCCLLF